MKGHGLSVVALVALGTLAGCGHWLRPARIPCAASQAALQARVTMPPDAPPPPADPVVSTPTTDTAREPPRAPTPEVQLFCLPDAVAFALEHSPRLRAARAAFEQARGEAEVAFAPFLPTVDFAYRYVMFESEVAPTSPSLPAVVGFGPGTRAFSQGELQLQWTLYDFGRTGNRYALGVTREYIAGLRWERAKQTVAYDTAVSYLQLLSARAARRIQEQAVERARAILDDTKARLKGGVVDRDDVLRAEVQLSETRENLATARQAEFDAVARLNFVMGRNVSCPIQVTDLDLQPGFCLSLGQCLDVAAGQRLEVTIARKTVAAATYGLQAVTSEFKPHIYMKGVVSRIDGTGVDDEWVEGVGFHFDQRLYAGGKRLGEKDAARAQVSGAVANAQLILDGIALDVNLAFREIAATRERIDLARTSVTQAEENLRLVRVKARNGDATPTDLVDAETALTRSQQRFAGATYQYLAGLARLDYAMGTPQGNLLHEPPAVPGTPTEVK